MCVVSHCMQNVFIVLFIFLCSTFSFSLLLSYALVANKGASI